MNRVNSNGGSMGNGNGNGWLRPTEAANGRKTMNGSSTNGHTHAAPSTQYNHCSLGLISTNTKRYLTAETFGFKINANGTSLKKKQTWRLEPASEGGIYLKSHLDRYLAVDQYGNVTCDLEEPGVGGVFELGWGNGSASNGNNKQNGASGPAHSSWTLFNRSRGYYLGISSSNPDTIICTAKATSDRSTHWSPHLDSRPQVTLKSIGRKRYARLSENNEEIYVDANVPWGSDTLFTLEFRFDSCLYAVRTCNSNGGQYFLRGDNGKLEPIFDPKLSLLFSLEYHTPHGYLALKDASSGLYLAPIGSKAILKTRSHTVTKDELFVLEDSVPQGAFVARLNGRFVSTKQGIDISANQKLQKNSPTSPLTNHETFQLEFDTKEKSWYIRTMQDKYWVVVDSNGGVQAVGDKKTRSSLFALDWIHDDDTKKPFLAIKSITTGKYVAAKRSGHLYANYANEKPGDDESQSAQFSFYLINRPTLVLKCDQGYVGYNKASGLLECNRANWECVQVESALNMTDEKTGAGEDDDDSIVKDGRVWFRGTTPSSSRKYWALTGDGITADSDTPTDFYIELKEPNRISIKTKDGRYLNAEKNGGFRVGQGGVPTMWEF